MNAACLRETTATLLLPWLRFFPLLSGSQLGQEMMRSFFYFTPLLPIEFNRGLGTTQLKMGISYAEGTLCPLFLLRTRRTTKLSLCLSAESRHRPEKSEEQGRRNCTQTKTQRHTRQRKGQRQSEETTLTIVVCLHSADKKKRVGPWTYSLKENN